MTEHELTAAWEDLAADKTRTDVRNRLATHYFSWVQKIAARMARRLPASVGPEDLANAGAIGLLGAIAGFRPERGFKFQTYALPRVRGAMLDWLRELDWVPRVIRMHANKLARASTELEKKLGRAPTDKQVARKLGIQLDELKQWQREAQFVYVGSLSGVLYETESHKQRTTIDMLVDPQDVPEAPLQRAELVKFVTRGCNKTERLIVVLYYLEHFTMKQIAQELGLSESRVSQMHSALLARLSESLQPRRSELNALAG